MRRVRGMVIALAVAAPLGCGGDDELTVERATAVPKDIVRSIPSAFARSAAAPRGTYAGRVGSAASAYIGVVVRGDRAVVYLCDGRATEWFGSRVRDGRIRVRSARGTVVDARVADGDVRGSVRPAGQGAIAFVAAAAREPGVGVFVDPDPALPGHLRRWIVLPDGIRGVSEQPAGAGTPATPTTDGTSNTIMFSESPGGTATTTTVAPPPAEAAGTTADGSSSTIMFEESPGGSGSTGSASVEDGTSNTVAIGERPGGGGSSGSSTPTDGSSDTITIGAGEPTTPPPATVTDGTSNTVMFGEEERPAQTGTSTVEDGSSNTVAVGEEPVNGVAGGDEPAQPPARPVTRCSTVAGCKTTTTTTLVSLATAKPTAPGKDGKPSFFAGGSVLTCQALERLIRTLLPAAKERRPGATAQLSALLAQAKAKRC